MATKAKSTSKAKTKSTPTKSAKTTRTTAAAARTTKKSAKVAPKTLGAPVTKQRSYNRFQDVNAAALVAEFIGTFLLVSAVMSFSGNAFFVGVALAVIVAAIFNISGAHVNPAVSFGLWTMRKVSGVKMATYWVAQFVGAMAALIAMNAYSGAGISISFANFTAFDWRIFLAELIGMSIFMFGIAAAAQRGQTDYDRAAGIGLSLFLALGVATGLLVQAANNNVDAEGNQVSERITKIESAMVNPAVALASTEVSASQQQQDPFAEAEAEEEPTTPATRLNLEVILGTLIGAALGGNLYLLLLRNREN